MNQMGKRSFLILSDSKKIETWRDLVQNIGVSSVVIAVAVAVVVSIAITVVYTLQIGNNKIQNLVQPTPSTIHSSLSWRRSKPATFRDLKCFVSPTKYMSHREQATGLALTIIVAAVTVAVAAAVVGVAIVAVVAELWSLTSLTTNKYQPFLFFRKSNNFREI